MSDIVVVRQRTHANHLLIVFESYFLLPLAASTQANQFEIRLLIVFECIFVAVSGKKRKQQTLADKGISCHFEACPSCKLNKQ